MAKNHPFRIKINCARPSFLEGMARVLDWGGTLNEYDIPYLDDRRAGRIPDFPDADADTGTASDAEAIHEIWVNTGNYLRGAMGMPLLDISEKRRLRMQARRRKQPDGAAE